VSATGATSATPCPAGTFSSSAGSTSCTTTPAGYFDGGTGNTAPTPCPAGTWSSPGSSSCTSALQLLNQAIDDYFGAGTGNANSLHKKVQDILNAPNANAKASALQNFISAVNAKRGNPLTDAQADYLIFLAKLL